MGPPIVGDVGLSDEEMVDPLYLGGVGGDDAQSRWDAPLRLLEVPCPVVYWSSNDSLLRMKTRMDIRNLSVAYNHHGKMASHVLS